MFDLLIRSWYRVFGLGTVYLCSHYIFVLGAVLFSLVCSLVNKFCGITAIVPRKRNQDGVVLPGIIYLFICFGYCLFIFGRT